MKRHEFTRVLPLIGLTGALALAGCDKPLDMDLRSLGKGFSTTSAVQQLGTRPAADARGVISYPTYRVALARNGDTVADVAARTGVNAAELARRNAISATTRLRGGELLTLPGGSTGAAAAPAAPNLPAGAEPLRHKVASGETVYSIARLYDTQVGALQQYNGLENNQGLRVGQTLLIPVAGTAVTVRPLGASTAGVSTGTPLPPSAGSPPPTETTAPVSTTTSVVAAKPPETTAASASSSGRMVRPMAGNIIREYNAGRNEGIDIAGTAGTSVKAADAGTVLHISAEKIVIIKHSGELLTVYRGLGNVSVSKGSSVSRGQTIGTLAAGSPAALHFEVRRGMQSVDPGNYLP